MITEDKQRNMEKKDPIENLIPFVKGQSGNPAGRPRKYTTLLKAQGYKMSEINDTIQNILSMTVEELTEVWNNPKATVLEKTVANAIKKGIQKGSLYSMETLLSRVYGQPKQEVQNNVTIEQPFFPDVSEDNSNQ